MSREIRLLKEETSTIFLKAKPTLLLSEIAKNFTFLGN
jgi:hypothetical protein